MDAFNDYHKINLLLYYIILYFTFSFYNFYSFLNNMNKKLYIDQCYGKFNENKNIHEILDNIQDHDIIILHGFDNIVYYKEKIVINNQKSSTFFVGKLIDFAGYVMNIRFTYKDISKIIYREISLLNFYEKSIEFNGYYPKDYENYLPSLQNNDVVEIFNQKEIIKVRIMDIEINDRDIMYSKCYGTIINQLDHNTRYNIFCEIVFYFNEIINIIQVASKKMHIYDENLIYKIIYPKKKKRIDDTHCPVNTNDQSLITNITQTVL